MLLQSSAWDILSIPHPEAPVLLPLTGPGRTQSRSLSRAQSSLSVPAGPGGGVPAGRCPVALPGPRPPRTDTKALTSRSAPFPVPLASPFPSQSLGRTHGCGSRSAPVPAAKSRPAAALGNFQPDDAGTYYCVKFIKGKTGEDEVFQHGSGTEVSVYGGSTKAEWAAHARPGQWPWEASCLSLCSAVQGAPAPPVKSWMQTAPTCPARAARKRTTSTTPTCSPCPRPCGAAGARAQPPPSMPASGQLPSDAWHRCLHGQPLSGWKKGRFCRAQ
ncbi:uncharacterized protein LOC107213130 isoform X4 [Parus major]|uniref:uncharacterized protein LOC107213130 isoform X4 n=1 Tax=Parus major TaxID=9157 RepID=UPI0007711BEE|nr:uncharacterized protein LOC107213130 isoform X4 [Parus major]